jgi:eukaryotic-like serine/threonine-protein kinase
MARVDRAELAGIEGFHRPVALKRMLPHVASDEEMVKAFVREARLASHLRHANVPQTYDLGKIDDIYFIAMELVSGPTLRHVLKHCALTTGPMPIPIALNILNQLCDALDYAHNLCDETGQPLGIIHRDVSPSNLIIDETGVVKLIDFGIAKASAAGMQTMSGTIKGKFGYMAPEYILGSIDARVDLFAVGVIAHELLTNRPLFSVADDMETLRRVRTMPLRPPSQGNPNVPPEVDDIVMTALARDPAQRWQHATALRTAMTTVTKRLGLECTNQQVIDWMKWAFEQTKPHGTPLIGTSGPMEDTDLSDPSVLQEPPTRSVAQDLPTRSVLRPAESPESPAASQMITVQRKAPPGQPAAAPAGTPAPAAAPGRYDGLARSPRTTDEIRTALIRPGGSRPESQPAAPADAPGLAQARTRSTSDQPQDPDDDVSDDVSGHNVTLLDGGAALRNRTAAQSVAQPSGGPPPPSGTTPPMVTINRSAPPPPQPMVRQSSSTAPAPMFRPRPSSQPPAVTASHASSQPPSRSSSQPPGPPPLGARPVEYPGDPARFSGRLAPPAPPAEETPSRRSSVVWVVLLVLLAAGLAAAAMYLVLPHLT